MADTGVAHGGELGSDDPAKQRSGLLEGIIVSRKTTVDWGRMLLDDAASI